MKYNKTLHARLDSLYRSYDKEYINSDPVQIPHRYTTKQDIEITGLLSASLAYGNVKQIVKSVNAIIGKVESSPHHFVLNYDLSEGKKLFVETGHRFNDGRDIALFFYYIHQIYTKYESLEDFFAEGYSGGDRDVRSVLSSFVDRIYKLDCSPFFVKGLPEKSSARYMFSSPDKGSPCKRMNMFLRWMVRDDSCDFGLWNVLTPSQLIIPLDTHIARICRYLGFTDRATNSWKTAEEITQSLRQYDENDPIKYDFALTRLGILNICKQKYDAEVCPECELFEFCEKTIETRKR